MEPKVSSKRTPRRGSWGPGRERRNAPYTDFPDYLEVVRESCGKKETDLFEAAAGKAAVARATFYFLLRYPELRPYSNEAIATLLEWH
jgi:endonuclease I